MSASGGVTPESTRLTWPSSCPVMYGEKPYSAPPTAAATTPGTQRRMTRNAKNDASARLSVITRLYVTMAPNSAVTGQRTARGIATGWFQSRLMPVGWFSAVETSGFKP